MPNLLMIRKIILYSFAIILLAGCKTDKSSTLFELLPGDQTGVHFANTLHEDDNLNILTYEYFYNGGGVGAGDINNDGLTDLFFAGNMSTSRLILIIQVTKAFTLKTLPPRPASIFPKDGPGESRW
jgi:hypothetical protein